MIWTSNSQAEQGIAALAAYSIFGIAVDRKHTLKWLFPQEKATFQCSQKVYVYSENALRAAAGGRLGRLDFEAIAFGFKLVSVVKLIPTMEAIMKLRVVASSIAAFLLMLVPSARAWGADKADVYFGYSRVGANLFAPNTAGMNGWQAAAHVKVIPFVGIEGDLSRYSQNPAGLSESVTLVMFGPRVTAHAAGFSVFAHGLAGLAHESATVTTFPSVSYNAASYALGAGADLPIFLGLKLRVTGDYLGNSKAPSSGSPAPAHYRIGVGVAFHF